MKETNGAQAIERVAVIGAGDAGRGFALACVAAGYSVVLEDVMPANLHRASVEYSAAGRGAGYGSLELSSTIEDAVRGADIVVDFVPDELESKLEIFCLLDRMAPPKTILCTPTKALSIADLASCVYRPERVFAVRGTLTKGSSVWLMSSGQADRAIAGIVERFLVSLGLDVIQEIDQSESLPTCPQNLLTSS